GLGSPVARGSGLVSEDAPRSGGPSPPLPVHQLLRGPRSSAPAGHLSALGQASGRRGGGWAANGGWAPLPRSQMVGAPGAGRIAVGNTPIARPFVGRLDDRLGGSLGLNRGDEPCPRLPIDRR